MEPMPVKPHLLYVAWGYPPCRGSGVYRAWATANAFARDGWRVTVLTAPRETFTMSTGADLSLERSIHPGIEIVRVPFSAPGFDSDLRNWSRFHASVPELWNGLASWLGERAFPERNYGGWRPTLEHAARRIHRENPVDLVIGTANPHVDFIPGWTLWRDAQIPYVMDYRDAWQLDVFSGARTTKQGSRVDRWERQLIAHAHSVWFVNEQIRQWHADVYPASADRMHVVSNGYDEPFTFDRPARDADSGVTFGYIGTLTDAVPLEQLLEGWQLARDRSPLLARSRIEFWGHLNHTGVPSGVVARLLPQFSANAIEYRGPVTKREIESVYARFDALILLLGTGRYVTSGKVFEYAATGSPVAAIHDPDNAASDVLRGLAHHHPVANLGPEAIAQALIATAEQAVTWTASDRAGARGAAQRFHRDAQLAPRIAALRADMTGAAAA